MNFFWVNLGTTYREVREHNFLWAPSHGLNKKGAVINNAGWLSVRAVKKGDLIFCNADGKLIYIATALSDAYSAPRPDTRAFKDWSPGGFKINLSLKILPEPVVHSIFKSEFCHRFNAFCIPKVFTEKKAVNQTVNQNYMCALPQAAGVMLLRESNTTNLISVLISNDETDDVQREGHNKTVTSSARHGQAGFRKDVLAYWNNSCAVTGINIPELLIASHIVPWELSSPKEKVDVHNGLALSPAVDKLFDKGYISFDENGKLIFTNLISEHNLIKLGLTTTSEIDNLTAKHHDYLARHRALYGFD